MILTGNYRGLGSKCASLGLQKTMFGFLSTFLKHFINMILFSKIIHSCAVQKRMKNTLDKKFRTACFFHAPVRFHSNHSTFLKTLISFHKYDII